MAAHRFAGQGALRVAYITSSMANESWPTSEINLLKNAGALRLLEIDTLASLGNDHLGTGMLLPEKVCKSQGRSLLPVHNGNLL